MIDFQITDGLGIAMIAQWTRWVVGVSYEEPAPRIRSIVFYAGPFRMHVIMS